MSKLLPGSNIYLIGMMGSGKTTIGKCLVEDLKDLKDLNYCFVDTDQEIEAKENRTIKEIFKTEGEAYFRKLETEVLKDLSDKTNHVIATGGGIIQQKNNYNWKYVQKGLTIWLDVDLEILKQRLAEDETRPLANDLESRLAFRRPFYAQSDIQIAIHQEQPPKEVSAQIKKMIPTVLKSQV